jgi:hypothetical protein
MTGLGQQHTAKCNFNRSQPLPLDSSRPVVQLSIHRVLQPTMEFVKVHIEDNPHLLDKRCLVRPRHYLAIDEPWVVPTTGNPLYIRRMHRGIQRFPHR